MAAIVHITIYLSRCISNKQSVIVQSVNNVRYNISFTCFVSNTSVIDFCMICLKNLNFQYSSGVGQYGLDATNAICGSLLSTLNFFEKFMKTNTKSVGITNTLKYIFDLIFWTTYKFKKASTSTIPGLRETSVNPYAVDTLSVVTKRQILRKPDTFGRRTVLFKYRKITFEHTDFAKSNNAYNRLLLDDVLRSIMNKYSIFTQQMDSEAIRTGIKDKKKNHYLILLKQWKLSISADSLLRTEKHTADSGAPLLSSQCLFHWEKQSLNGWPQLFDL